MADDNDIEEPEDDGTDLIPRRHVRDLEAKARRADELEAQLAKAEREGAFAKALGSATTEPWFRYFEKGYDGELDPDTIRAAASEAGFGRQAEPQPDQPPADLAAHQRMATAASGAGTPGAFDPLEAIAKAQSPEEVMQIVEAHGEKYGVISSRLTQ
jgi:hypothetical protein